MEANRSRASDRKPLYASHELLRSQRRRDTVEQHVGRAKGEVFAIALVRRGGSVRRNFSARVRPLTPDPGPLTRALRCGSRGRARLQSPAIPAATRCKADTGQEIFAVKQRYAPAADATAKRPNSIQPARPPSRVARPADASRPATRWRRSMPVVVPSA